MAKFVFLADTARVPEPPRSMAALLDWARANPGRFTHPDPSNFMGATFLKQALVALAPDPALLQAPVTDAAYAAATAPMWAWYDALRPLMWRGGRTFPPNQSVQEQLLNDGEVDIAMSFDPASTAAGIAQGLLPETARVFVPEGGTLGNVSFVAIPFNAAHKECWMRGGWMMRRAPPLPRCRTTRRCPRWPTLAPPCPNRIPAG